MRVMGDQERRIAEVFNDYFVNFDIRISPEDVDAGSRRTIRDSTSGWAVTYRVDRDAAGVLNLEFYATNRRTNDRHVLISGDGQCELLDAVSELVISNSDNAVDDFEDRNEVIARQLRDRGLYPHGQDHGRAAAPLSVGALQDNETVGKIRSDNHIHVAQGSPWKDAIIKLLQPRSPYRPWQGGVGAAPGDAVVAVLDTEPSSVIADVRQVGPDGSAERAIAGCIDPARLWKDPPALLELATLTALTGMSYSHGRADVTVYSTARLAEVMSGRMWNHEGLSYLHGHSTLAAARILLQSHGRCSGCDGELDLSSVNARYDVHIHTVDFDPAAPLMRVADDPPPEENPAEHEIFEYSGLSIRLGPERWRPMHVPPDWPAVLCDGCHNRMRRRRFTSFSAFRFSLHPSCPSCSAQWTMRTTAGFVARPPEEPWIWHTGCTPDEKWRCRACGHKWNGTDRRGGIAVDPQDFD